MDRDTEKNRKRLQSFLCSFMLIAIGVFGGLVLREPGGAYADNRRSPQRKAFQSGSERSETVLREIASTLKRIEARIDKIHAVAVAQMESK